MTGEQSGAQAPDRKISEAFLDFASPLIEAVGSEPGDSEMDPILKLAFTVWNAVVIDTIKGDTRLVDQIRRSTAGEPGLVELMEHMIHRKRTLFADDNRLVGKYEWIQRNGQWILRAEARDPASIPG